MTELSDLLKKGALIAQNPASFEAMDELDEDEKTALRRETTHKWSQPRTLYLTIILCSIGAAVQYAPYAVSELDLLSLTFRACLCRGWDQTGSNGANLTFPADFGILPVQGTPDYDKNNWLVGLVNAAPYISAALWYDSRDLNIELPVVKTTSVVVAGWQIHSTSTSDAVAQSSSVPSSVSSQSLVLVSAKHGNSSLSAVYYLASVWAQKQPRFLYSPQKTYPL